MERKAYGSGRRQTDHLPVMFLHVQRQRDDAQLVRRNIRSGKTSLATNLEGSTVDVLSG